ncbi:MAG TPA: hypothetical protein VNK43_02925 [Gemmatimonadales bacterium]|nr:hypothetical protein [Gemmatimonadales bacterium]
MALLACHRAPQPLVPVAAPPASPEQVREWVAATAPRGHVLYRFRWLFRDDRSSAGGRGSARMAAPDSLRFDVTGPLGSRAASAVVVGDSALWAEPPDAVRDLVPNYPLLWALFGVARLPEDGAELRGVQDAATTAWQYARAGDTVTYVRRSGRENTFLAEVRHGGRVVGRAETTFDDDGTPRSARLTVPSVPARLDITFTASASASAFPPEIWRPRQP